MGSYTLVVAPMGVKFGVEEGTEGPLLHAKFHPHRCNVSPLRGEKPQNRPLSKRNTGRFALSAMLPVKKTFDGFEWEKVAVVHARSTFALRHIRRHYKMWDLNNTFKFHVSRLL